MPDALQFLVLTVAGWVNRHHGFRREITKETIMRTGLLAGIAPFLLVLSGIVGAAAARSAGDHARAGQDGHGRTNLRFSLPNRHRDRLEQICKP